MNASLMTAFLPQQLRVLLGGWPFDAAAAVNRAELTQGTPARRAAGFDRRLYRLPSSRVHRSQSRSIVGANNVDRDRDTRWAFARLRADLIRIAITPSRYADHRRRSMNDREGDQSSLQLAASEDPTEISA
jgi:hypothetical protein